MPHFVRYSPKPIRSQRRWLPTVASVASFIAGDASGTSLVSGTLSGSGYIEGTVAGSATVQGTLSGNGYIEATSSGTVDVQGTLTGAGNVEGSASGSTAESADIYAIGYLEGTSTGVASATGTMEQPEGSVIGVAAGVATVTGTLHGVGNLAGTSAGDVAVSAEIKGSVGIAASATGQAGSTAILRATVYVSTDSAGVSSVSATLQAKGYLSGSVSGGSSATLVAPDVVEVEDSVPMLSAGIWRKSQPNTILFVLTDSDGNEVTGLGNTFSLQIRKIGGSFVSGSGTKSEVGLGWYQYISTAAEANTSGPVAIVVTGAGIIQQNLEYVVEDRVVGAVEFTYTVTNSVTSQPIPNVDVNFSVSSSPEDTVWRGITDAFGVARDLNGNLPRLIPGNYFIFSYRPGFVFDTDTETVSA